MTTDSTKLGPDEIEQLSSFDSFKMFKNNLDQMATEFKLFRFADCEQVSHPGEKTTLFVILQGQVNVISDEKIYKKVN